MNKIIRLMQNYLLFAFPFVVACMAWQTFQPENQMMNLTGVAYAMWLILAFNLMLWFTTLIIFLIMLVVVPSVRDKTLRRLANLKERDEREQYITGKAARATYISTMSLMILLLFLSIFTVKVFETPITEGTHHKKLTVKMGVQFGLLNKAAPINNTADEKVLFESKQLSTPAVILILLVWQLLIFNLVARKVQVEE